MGFICTHCVCTVEKAQFVRGGQRTCSIFTTELRNVGVALEAEIDAINGRTGSVRPTQLSLIKRPYYDGYASD